MEFRDILEKLLKEENLSPEEAYALFRLIMSGEIDESKISASLIALRMKGETTEEIIGAARAMREFSVKVKTSGSEPVCDTCGTGGDSKGTFNVSTAVAIALSAGGCFVAKHGNRSVSSRTGSADVLELMGIRIDLKPEEAEEWLNKVKFAFLFAPLYHPAMKNAMPVRRSLGVRTLFNILGPLTNPAGAKRQIIGVFDPHFAEKIFETGDKLSYENLMVVCGAEGLDEVSISGKTKVWFKRGNEKNAFEILPTSYGLSKHPIEEIQVNSASESAEIIHKISRGKAKSAQYEFFLLNAGCAFYSTGKARSIEEGLEIAEEVIKSSSFEEKLERLIDFSRGR